MREVEAEAVDFASVVAAASEKRRRREPAYDAFFDWENLEKPEPAQPASKTDECVAVSSEEASTADGESATEAANVDPDSAEAEPVRQSLSAARKHTTRTASQRARWNG